MRRHVILLGLPGSGKSTVGRLVADELGSAFVDVDEEIERAVGRSIASIFDHEGEAGFRARERATMLKLLARQPAVIAPGGGWAAWGRNLADAADETFLVYLRTRVPTAAERTASDASRPLLRGGGRAERLEELVARRAPFYERADAAVDTDARAPEEVAREVARLARTQAGW